MAKKQKKNLYLNKFAVAEFQKKFHQNVSMNFFSNKKIIVSKSCYTKNLAYLLGEFNGICVNDWQDEKSTYNVLILSAIDIQELEKGNYFNDVYEAIQIMNRRQTIIDENKLSADIYIIKETDFIDYYNNREKYIKEYKAENFNSDELFRLLTIPTSDTLF